MISPCLHISVLAAATVLIMAVPAANAGELRRTAANRINGQYIVVLRDDASALATERSSKPKTPVLAQEMAKAHGARVKYAYSQALRGFAVSADTTALKKLLADPRVAYVE
ncbi:MAG TPA: protease inhibitor I9 family protein, partial [Lysobacter sp.]|nr:protease inhibitor I9 family protein [Lysobacter sp.]